MIREDTNRGLETLIPADRLQARIGELAETIERDYAGTELLIAVGVLKGSVFFLVDLLKRVSAVPVAVDFFQTSSYGGGTSPGEVRIRKDLDLSIRGRDVLLIEDIVDTGYTLRTILDLLRWRGAKSVRLCALLDKAPARQVEVPIDYCGFPIDDVFVVGYGLDYEERYRNLPYIGVMTGGGESPAPRPTSQEDEL
jgi:hypoxanthine phosphoribosyltransferase